MPIGVIPQPMLSVFRKEISSFFSSPVGYLVMGLFLVLCGLFLWVFKGPFNIFDYGFADLSLFFLLSPWVLLFLSPAVSMRSFSEERKTGTLELLLSRPIPTSGLVYAKFLGVLALAGICLAPTLLYVLTLSNLGAPPGNLDMGLVWGSYLGLFFLIAVYTSVGLLASSLTENQIAAFILAVMICFILYYGPESLASLIPDGGMALGGTELGLKAHYEYIGQGILDSRDLIYFLSLTLFFNYLTINRLNQIGA